jgi:hypothetical protein
MGTTYTVMKKGKLTVELDEMSNLFALHVTGTSGVSNEQVMVDMEPTENWARTSTSLAPDDVIKMALEMLKVASYWCDSDDFDKAVRDWRGSEVSYEATMLRSIGKVGAE